MGAVVCATTSAYGQSKPARARLMINLESSPPPPVYMSGIICVKCFHKDSLKVKNQSHIVAKIKKKKKTIDSIWDWIATICYANLAMTEKHD